MNLRRTIPVAAAAAFLGWRALRRSRAVDLSGQVALVTGGSRGLGLLIARELGRQGCKVAICARDPEELERARQDILPRGAEAVMAVRCDVSDRAQVERMVEQVEAQLGHIGVLVNNASIIQVGPLDRMQLYDFQQAMDVNFWGSVYTTLAVLPGMRERGAGRIVNITSIGGEVAMPHLLPYDCAKFASVGFSEGLHAELAAAGVVVTTVIPGLMRTGGHRHAFFKGKREREYAWFAAGDQAPIIAMSAKRAAWRIVEACRRGEAVVTLTWQAKLLRVFHALLPGLTDEMMALVNRALPGPGNDGQFPLRGETVATS